MEKIICLLLVFLIATSVKAQEKISVNEVVFINDEFDRIIDDEGNAGIQLNCGLWSIYDHCLYFSIQIEDSSILIEDQSPFIVKFRNCNDTVQTFMCDSFSQDFDGNYNIWLVAPFRENHLPFDRDFIIQDIVLECNQMPSALQENVELIYHDISSNEYLHLECKNFSAPYYSDEKSVYHQICEYPNDLEDLKKYKMSTKKDVTPTKIDFNMDDFNMDDFDEEQ